MGSRPSRPAIALGVAAVVLFAALGALELVARVLERPPTPRKTQRYISADPTLPELKTFGDLDSTFQRGIHKGVLYETNRLRLRSPERPQVKPDGVFRIALLGDSYVMGEGVLVEDAYATLLERELPSFRPGVYEVINTGMSGLDIEHAVARYAELGVAYDPDLAIYGFTINDIEGPHYEKSVASGPDPYGVESSPLALWRLIGPGWVALREAYWPLKEGYVYELRHNYDENEAAWDDFVTSLDGLITLNNARGICSVIFIHTHLVTLNSLHPFSAIYAKVGRAAEARGFFPVQSLPIHLGQDARGLWVNAFDSHPNARGHRLLADALVEGLRDLPNECWQSTSDTASDNIPKP